MKTGNQKSSGSANHQILLGLFAIVTAFILLSGCATKSARADADMWKYNLETGYPAVGASE